MLFPVIFGALVWLPVYMTDRQLRAVFPWVRSEDNGAIPARPMIGGHVVQ
jgi:hypothetical protein